MLHFSAAVVVVVAVPKRRGQNVFSQTSSVSANWMHPLPALGF